MKLFYFIFFLIINLLTCSTSSDLDQLIDKEEGTNYRFERRARIDNLHKPDQTVNFSEVLRVIVTVKERAVMYEKSLDIAERVLGSASDIQAGRSGSVVVTGSGNVKAHLPPRYKRASGEYSPISKSVAQILPEPRAIKLEGGLTVPKYGDSPKGDHQMTQDDARTPEQKCDNNERDIETLKRPCNNPVTVASMLSVRNSGPYCLNPNGIRLSGKGKYKTSRSSSEVIQCKRNGDAQLSGDNSDVENLNEKTSVGCHMRGASPDPSREIYHCARRSLEYGGASLVCMHGSKDASKIVQLMRSVSDVGEKNKERYAINIRSVALDMLDKVLGKVCLVARFSALSDLDLLKLEFILLFANINEQYLLNPDYKSAEFCKLLMNRKYLLVFLLNNEHFIRSGRILDGSVGSIFRHHIVGNHASMLLEALKSGADKGDFTISAQLCVGSENSIGSPQIVKNEIMSKSEFNILRKAFVEIYRIEEEEKNAKLYSTSSSSSLRDRSRSVSSTFADRHSVTSEHPRHHLTARPPRFRYSYIRVMRELNIPSNQVNFNFCLRCVLL